MNADMADNTNVTGRQLSDEEIDGLLHDVEAAFDALSPVQRDNIRKSVDEVEKAWATARPTEPTETCTSRQAEPKGSERPGTRPFSGIGNRGRPPSDAELIESVRLGKVEAYGLLYERHVRAASILALQLCPSSSDADDLVADAFAKVLAALKAGGGPAETFRPYLLTAVRHAAFDKTRKAARTDISFGEASVRELDQALAASAFASLPERWQTVLWHTAIEGQSPDEIAPLMGLTANGVSAMAFRAREGLRKAFFQAHTQQEPSKTCRDAVMNLGAWTRGRLSQHRTEDLNRHLDTCSSCRAFAAELADVNGAVADVHGTIRKLVAPVVLGADTDRYLACQAGVSKANPD